MFAILFDDMNRLNVYSLCSLVWSVVSVVLVKTKMKYHNQPKKTLLTGCSIIKVKSCCFLFHQSGILTFLNEELYETGLFQIWLEYLWPNGLKCGVFPLVSPTSLFVHSQHDFTIWPLSELLDYSKMLCSHHGRHTLSCEIAQLVQIPCGLLRTKITHNIFCVSSRKVLVR